jgi:hypothetical protein
MELFESFVAANVHDVLWVTAQNVDFLFGMEIQGAKWTPADLRLLEMKFNYHICSKLCVLRLLDPHRLSFLQEFTAS